MSEIGKLQPKRISCIPNNKEKYISFTIGNLRFIDSLQFLNASLSTLVNNLASEGPNKFPTLRSASIIVEEGNINSKSDNKTKSILNHVNLQQYLSLALKLTKMHRILALHQSPWLKAYIDFNIKRKEIGQK